MNKIEKFQRFLVAISNQGVDSFTTEAIIPAIKKYFIIDDKLASKYLKEMHIAELISINGSRFIIEYHKVRL